MLLLGAHFFRYGNIELVILSAALLPLLIVRKPWVIHLFQTVLVLGGIEWIRTLVVLSKMRQAAGAPWMRMAVILGIVAALTICSAFVFRFKSLRERYRLIQK